MENISTSIVFPHFRIFRFAICSVKPQHATINHNAQTNKLPGRNFWMKWSFMWSWAIYFLIPNSGWKIQPTEWRSFDPEVLPGYLRPLLSVLRLWTKNLLNYYLSIHVLVLFCHKFHIPDTVAVHVLLATLFSVLIFSPVLPSAWRHFRWEFFADSHCSRCYCSHCYCCYCCL